MYTDVIFYGTVKSPPLFIERWIEQWIFIRVDIDMNFSPIYNNPEIDTRVKESFIRLLTGKKIF